MRKLNITGIIGSDITFDQVVEALDFNSTERIEINIDSNGGLLTETFRIVNYLNSLPATITTIINPVAASAASYLVASVSDKIKAYKNSSIMLHRASNIFQGNSTEQAINIELLQDYDKIMIQAFKDKFKLNEEHLLSKIDQGDFWIVGEDKLKKLGIEIIDDYVEKDDIFKDAMASYDAFKQNYVNDIYKTDLDKLVALLPPTTKEIKLNKEEDKFMNLEEIIKSNPSIANEIEAKIKSEVLAKSMIERERIRKIFAINGVNDSAIEAVNSGMTYEQFMELSLMKIRDDQQVIAMADKYIPTKVTSVTPEPEIVSEDKLRAAIKGLVKANGIGA